MKQKAICVIAFTSNSVCMMLTHLPAGLLVLHAHTPDPTAGFSALFQAAELPPLMKQGVMDPLILKHYLLLHDDQGQPNGLEVPLSR